MSFSRQPERPRSAVFAEIWQAYECGGAIVRCAWCGQIQLAEGWIPPPLDALAAIDARLATSHSICPSCLAEELGARQGGLRVD